MNALTCDQFADHYKENQQDKVLLDVRSPQEISDTGTLPDATTIPIDQIEAQFSSLNKNASVYVFCAAGLRAERVAGFLQEEGFQSVFYAIPGGFLDLKRFFF